MYMALSLLVLSNILIFIVLFMPFIFFILQSDRMIWRYLFTTEPNISQTVEDFSPIDDSDNIYDLWDPLSKL